MWGLGFCVAFFSLFLCSETAFSIIDRWHFQVIHKFVIPILALHSGITHYTLKRSRLEMQVEGGLQTIIDLQGLLLL